MRLKCGLHYPRYSSYNYNSICLLHTASDLSHVHNYVTKTPSINIISLFLQLMLTYLSRFSRYATVTNFLLKMS